MSIKHELHRLVDLLDEEDEESVLDYLRWLLTDEDTLTEEERAAVLDGEAQIARGEYVTLDELVRSLRE